MAVEIEHAADHVGDTVSVDVPHLDETLVAVGDERPEPECGRVEGYSGLIQEQHGARGAVENAVRDDEVAAGVRGGIPQTVAGAEGRLGRGEPGGKLASARRVVQVDPVEGQPQQQGCPAR